MGTLLENRFWQAPVRLTHLVNLTLTTQMPAPAARKPAGGMDAAQPLLQNKHGNARAQKRDRHCPAGPDAGARLRMKHPSNREFYTYWNDKRGAARAPDRSEIEPGAVRGLLGDIFVLSYDATGGFPFRVAGTRVAPCSAATSRTAAFRRCSRRTAAARSRTSSRSSPKRRWPRSPASPRPRRTARRRISNCCAAVQSPRPCADEFDRLAGAVRRWIRPVARFQVDVVALSRSSAAAFRSPRLEETRGGAWLHGL